MGENTPRKNPIEVLIETGQQLIQEQNHNIQEQKNNIKEQREIAEEFNENLSELKELCRKLEVSKFDINETDRELITNVEKGIKKLKTLYKLMAICFSIAIISALVNVYKAKSWYDTSIKTNREIREQIFKQIADEGKIITERKLFDTYKNEREIIKIWVESNPRDSKSYNTYRTSVITAEQNKNFFFFENLQNDDNIIHGGGKSRFFK